MEFNFKKLIPQSKAQPDLSNLTPYELEQLQKVFEKQEKFEKELQSSINALQTKVQKLENKDGHKQSEKNGLKTCRSNISLSPASSPKLCFICKRAVGSISSETFFVRNETMQCHTCLRLVCDRCGSLKNPLTSETQKKNKKNTISVDNLEWNCKICAVKLEVAKKSDIWMQSKENNQAINELKPSSEKQHTTKENFQEKSKEEESSIKKYFDYFPSIQKGLNLFGSKTRTVSLSNFNNRIKSVLGDSNRNNKDSSTHSVNTESASHNKISNTYSNFNMNIITPTPKMSTNSLINPKNLHANVSDSDEVFGIFGSSISSNLSSQLSAQLSYSPSRYSTKSLSPSILTQAIHNRDQNLEKNFQGENFQLTSDSPPFTRQTLSPKASCKKNMPTIESVDYTDKEIKNFENINRPAIRLSENEDESYDKIIEINIRNGSDSNNLKDFSKDEEKSKKSKPKEIDAAFKKIEDFNIQESEIRSEKNSYSPLVKPKPTKIVFKRANSLFVPTQSSNLLTEQNDSSSKLNSEEEHLPELIKQPPIKNRKNAQARSHSNEITVSTRDLNDFIKQQSNDYDGDENLTNLAKVILIEHKRSLQLTNTQDSSISSTIFTPTESTSRRDSFSSRQDSSISVTESEIIRQASRRGQEHIKKNALRNSKEWQRRKMTMKKSKKWSTANLDVDFENQENFDDECSSNDANQSYVSNDSNESLVNTSFHKSVFNQRTLSTSSSNQFSSSNDNELRPKQSVEVEAKDSTESFSIHVPNPVEKPLYISKCNIQSSSSEIHKSFSVSFSEDHKQPSTTTDESNDSNSSGKKKTENSRNISKPNVPNIAESKKSIASARPSRKLPEIPLHARLSSTNVNKNPPMNQSPINHYITRSNENIENQHQQSVSPSLSLQNNEAHQIGRKRKLRNLDSKKASTSSKSSRQSNFSKTIDSADSFKSSKKENNKNFHSVDLEKAFNKKDTFFFSERNSPQRSIDYPCIIRKPPKLSDLVRKRLLFKKVSRGITQLGETFSSSVEKEHIPKVPRKIIIKQDNSIELGLVKPPKLRVQAASLDMSVYSRFSESTTTTFETQIKQPSMLSVTSSNSFNDRRKTIETCENIFLQSEESTKLRAKTPPSNPHRILLYKDPSNKSIRMNGLGMRIVGGHECEDGSLGCFVTLVVKGGPAEANNIEVGDQILVFNGHSLVDATYEEVRNHQNNCGDYVQLVVQHNNIRNSNHSPLENSRQFETVPRLSQSITRKRRNLPPLPSSKKIDGSPEDDKKKVSEYVITETLQVPILGNLLKPILINRGRLLMQIWDNSKCSKFAITINQANNLPSRNESKYSFITGRVIFDEQGVKTFETISVPLESNNNPVWNETFVFDNMNEQMEDINLEICLYDSKTQEDKEQSDGSFVGMLILPLSEANLEDEPRWYELRDKPTRKSSTVSVTFKSSEGSLESLNEKIKNKKKNNNKGRKFSLLSLTTRKSSLQPIEISENDMKGHVRGNRNRSPVGKLTRALTRLLSFRRSSESGIKHSIIKFDDDIEEKNSELANSNLALNKSTIDLQQISPKNLLNISGASSRKSSNISNIDLGEDIDRYFNDEEICKINDPKPGPGQIPPKAEHKTEEIIAGNIKLGFLMTKGQLEITVFEARNLNKLIHFTKEGTYIKTYLRTGSNKLHKKKTQVIKNSPDPVFNTKLCYKACNVLGRRIQVLALCQKTLKLENLMIGEAFIELDLLDLSKPTIGWYKLYKQNCVDDNFYDST